MDSGLSHWTCLSLSNSFFIYEDSYLILDEDMCFLNCQDGGKEKGRSILDIQSKNELYEILSQTGFDVELFEKRDGNYYVDMDSELF